MAGAAHGASARCWHGGPTSARKAPPVLPILRGGVVRAVEQSVERRVEAIELVAALVVQHPGCSRATASSSANAAISPPERTKSPRLICTSTWVSMKRWSIPSYRPHSKTAPSLADQRSTAPWFRGAPIGEKRTTGASWPATSPRSARTAARQRCRGGAIITIPGHRRTGDRPRAGSCPRHGRADSTAAHQPGPSHRARRVTPLARNGPNSSGNRVMTSKRMRRRPGRFKNGAQ